jgi:hypothetical protein
MPRLPEKQKPRANAPGLKLQIEQLLKNRVMLPVKNLRKSGDALYHPIAPGIRPTRRIITHHRIRIEDFCHLEVMKNKDCLYPKDMI